MRTVPSLALLCLFAACGAAPTTTAAAGAGAAGAAQDPAGDGGGAAKAPAADPQQEPEQLQKELDGKRRELAYARREQEAQELGDRMRLTAARDGLAESRRDRDKAARELEVFDADVLPRESEAKQIGLDAQSQRAKEAKAEYAELQAMYEADEFAKATKELVLERGRAQMELAARRLEVARAELRHWREHEMQVKAKDLAQAVADAEAAVEKAELEQQKAEIEVALARQKAQDKVEDLARDIEELRAKLAKQQARQREQQQEQQQEQP